MDKQEQEEIEELFALVEDDIRYGLVIGVRRAAQNLATTAFELFPDLRDPSPYLSEY